GAGAVAALAAGTPQYKRPDGPGLLPVRRAAGDDAGGTGAGGGGSVGGGGVFGDREGGGRSGPVRGGQVGGLGTAHHPGAVRPRAAEGDKDAGGPGGAEKATVIRVKRKSPRVRRPLTATADRTG